MKYIVGDYIYCQTNNNGDIFAINTKNDEIKEIKIIDIIHNKDILFNKNFFIVNLRYTPIYYIIKSKSCQ